jgi:hypothetical protein
MEVSKIKLEKIYNRLSLTKGELVLTVGLVAALVFFLSLMQRIEYTTDPSVFITYWGFPFEMIKVKNTVGTGMYPDIGLVVNVTRIYEFLWDKIIINLLIYILFSIVVVKLANWIREEIEYRRYYASH